MNEADTQKLRDGIANVEAAIKAEQSAAAADIAKRDELIKTYAKLVENQDNMLAIYRAQIAELTGYTVLKEPLKASDMDTDGWLEGIVELDLARIIDLGHAGVLDELSELLTGTDLLQDFSWDVVGWDHTRPGQDVLHIKVAGNASSCFSEEE